MSRACISQNDDYIYDSDYIAFNIEALPVSQAKLSKRREETHKDGINNSKRHNFKWSARKQETCKSSNYSLFEL